MISLTEQLAQAIVNKMMDVIPYNVNIMDSNGIIIGSGDNNRIGKIHEGAIQAISLKKLISIYKDTEDVKRGVNMPIYFRDKIAGVIGISGDPNVVNQFASIVTVTAELLINQEYMFSEKRTREQIKEQILYQLAFLDEPYKEDFIKRANSLGIDLTLPRRAVAISSINRTKLNFDKIRNFINDNEYIIRLNPENFVLLLIEDERMLNFRVRNFRKNLSENSIISIGKKNSIISKSVNEALKCIEIIKRFNVSINISSYDDIIPIDALSNVSYKEDYKSIILKLEEDGKGSELVKTLLSFIKHNGEISAIAKELHIHRNSLNYRIQKIKDITGKDPKNFLDLLHLFTALVVFNLS